MSGPTREGSAVSMDQLVALNEDMAALVRAGVPLEQGLIALGRDMPGALGAAASEIGSRMSAGESLLQILESNGKRFPPVWRAVVRAGVRSGHLAAALEGMAATGRRVLELRRVVGAGLVYPLIVVAVAYGLFVLLAVRVEPALLSAMTDLTSARAPLLAVLAWLGGTALFWAPWPPVIAAVLLAVWRRRSSRTVFAGGGGASLGRPGRLERICPLLGHPLRDGRLAAFAEILSLLVRQETPLPEAVVLAAQASGDRGLMEAADAMAERLRSGAVSSGPDAALRFPPLLDWLIASGAQQPGLARSLALTGETYRRRAERAAAWRTVYVPLLATVFVGGAAVLLQTAAVFAPYCRLLYALGRPF